MTTSFQSQSPLSELARRDPGGLRLRLQPLRMTWSFDDLVSSDGHALAAAFSCSIRPLPDGAEQKMLEEVFLSSSSVLRSDAVIGHFQHALRTAAAGVCQAKAATELVGSTAAGNAALIDAIKTAANRIAFSCGIEVLAPFHVDVTSETLERQRQEALQRSLAEQRATGQVEHFQRAAEMLKQFQQIREGAPQLSAGDVLKQLNPADQGLILQTLILAGAKEKTTEAVWAVAGPNLLRVDPQAAPVKAQVLPLPTSLGPLRSVQPTADGSGQLLIGARSGVLLALAEKPGEAVAYSDVEVSSQLGFNRALLMGGQIWSSHSECGIVAWKLDEPSRPLFALRPGELMNASARNLQPLGGSRLIFSTQNRLMTLALSADGAGRPTVSAVDPVCPAEVIAILPSGERLFVILMDGTVQERNPETLAVVRQEKRCGEVCSAALLPWLGSARILLASEAGPVYCVGADDDLVSQYLSPYPALKALAAAPDVIAGISGDRQRLVLWQTWAPRQPVGDLFIPSIAKHRVADVDI